MQARWMTVVASLGLAVGCAGTVETGEDRLADRAYVVSEGSDELFVLDHERRVAVGSVDTGLGREVNRNHMAVVTPDGSKVYVAATAHDAVVVVDAAALEVTARIDVGAHPTHLAVRPDGGELWVVNEDDDSVSVIDTRTDEVVHTVTDESLRVPHFVRFAADAAYVPSIGGNQITAFDLDSYEVRDVIALGEGAGPCSAAPCGFADAQIGDDGVLVAAHIASGTVLSYDTRRGTRLETLGVGRRPWAVFVGGPAGSPGPAMMPNWDDASVSVLEAAPLAEVARTAAGDHESYGVSFSRRVPDEAFVLARTERRVNVVDRRTGQLVDRIAVDGSTETATTTADGRTLLVPLSSADAIAVIDVESHEIVAQFEGIGDRPWSVTAVGAQSYCH